MPEYTSGNLRCTRAIGAAGALAILLAGCAGNQGARSVPETDGRQASTAAAPALHGVPVLLSSVDLKLPIEAYLLSNSQETALHEADGTLLARCMKGFGLSYDAGAPLPAVGPRSLMDRRYGLTDLSMAKADGYHLGARDPRTHPIKLPPAPTGSALTVLRGPSQPPAQGGQASPGSTAVFEGKQIPPLGCAGVAESELAGSNHLGVSNIAQDLNDESFRVTMKDPHVQAAFRDWSGCMRKAGYTYSDPMAVMADPRFQGKNPTPLEIRVATADVTCKGETNLVGIWFAVETAYQKTAIQQNKPALDAALRAKEEQLAAAAAVNSAR